MSVSATRRWYFSGIFVWKCCCWQKCPIIPFTTENPFWGAKLLGFSIERGLGALKGLIKENRKLWRARGFLVYEAFKGTFQLVENPCMMREVIHVDVTFCSKTFRRG